jgi:hypothetical protein
VRAAIASLLLVQRNRYRARSVQRNYMQIDVNGKAAKKVNCVST